MTVTVKISTPRLTRVSSNLKPSPKDSNGLSGEGRALGYSGAELFGGARGTHPGQADPSRNLVGDVLPVDVSHARAGNVLHAAAAHPHLQRGRERPPRGPETGHIRSVQIRSAQLSSVQLGFAWFCSVQFSSAQPSLIVVWLVCEPAQTASCSRHPSMHQNTVSPLRANLSNLQKHAAVTLPPDRLPKTTHRQTRIQKTSGRAAAV